ncbi:MAG: hypothetical protein QXG05_05705 [Nitrososphaerota archaeon]
MVKIRLHRSIKGIPKTCTIIRDIDHCHACISMQLEPNLLEQQSGKPVGVDLGILNLATLSNGIIFENPRHLDNSITRITTLQMLVEKEERFC